MKYARGLFLPILAIFLLIFLAILQFNWLGQVSDAQLQQLQRNLENDATRVTEAMDREVSRAFNYFMVGVFESSNRPMMLAERERQWKEHAPYPEIVSAVFLVSQKPGPDNLRQLQPSGDFVNVAWPEELEPLYRIMMDGGPGVGPRFLMAEIPALVLLPSMMTPHRRPPQLRIPASAPWHKHSRSPAPRTDEQQHTRSRVSVMDEQRPPPERSNENARERIPGPFSEFIVVTLNQDYMCQSLFPELLRVNVHQDAHLNLGYRLERLVRKPELIAADGTLTPKDPQVRKNFMRLRDFPDLAPPQDLVVNPAEQDWHASAEYARTVEQARHLTHLAFETGQEGIWRLSMGHSGDSLNSLVAHTRNKNLAISFGVLILLGASLVYIQMGTSRARDLARRQLEFVAGISHELLTPLAGIRGAGQNLGAGVVTEKEKVINYGKVIEKESDRLADLVRQVMAYSGMQSGHGVCDRSPLLFNEVLNEGIDDCRPLLAQHGFQLETMLASDLGWIVGDRLALRRVLQNLFGNAVKYASRNKWVRLSAECEDGFVCLSVEDRGQGIEAADLRHLFEPFFRGHKQVASNIPGSGLGLCIVKHIVEQHGGTIVVTSTPGVGACFRVRLPRLKQPIANYKEEEP